MNNYNIIIDSKKQWTTIYNKTCERIQQLSKEISGKRIFDLLK